jgi:hypothetical protein
MANSTFQIDSFDRCNFRTRGEQLQYLARLLADFVTTDPYGEDDFPEEHKPNLVTEFKQALRQLSCETICMLTCAIRNVAIVRRNDELWRHRIVDRLLNRNPKPRNIQRDREIVRLHDECKKSFGEIPRILAEQNPAWVGKNGKRLKRDTVERAYHRLQVKLKD